MCAPCDPLVKPLPKQKYAMAASVMKPRLSASMKTRVCEGSPVHVMGNACGLRCCTTCLYKHTEEAHENINIPNLHRSEYSRKALADQDESRMNIEEDILRQRIENALNPSRAKEQSRSYHQVDPKHCYIGKDTISYVSERSG